MVNFGVMIILNTKDGNKTLSVEEYLNKIRPYLKDKINNLKKSDSWKIELTVANNFISPKDDNDEEQVKYSKSDNIEIMINDRADEVIKELFKLLKDRYQNSLNRSKVVSVLLILLH